ncbi:MAG: NAD-dependent epimerase/dehydratase family protein [Solirubrobacterales bacterium]
MKALVTGGAGFIGSHLVDALVERGDEVLVLDNLSSGRRENLAAHADEDCVRLEPLDITEAGPVLEVFASEPPDAVFHLAAQIDVRVSVADPGFDASSNVVGTVNLLEAARRNGAPGFIFTSTGGGIYGEGEGRSLPFTEAARCLPDSPYGQSKLAAEGYLDLYSRAHGLAACALRLGNVYGPRQDPHGEAGVVAIFGGLALAGGAPTVFGDGAQTRDYIYVGDVVGALLAAQAQGSQGVLNVGTGVETDVLRLAEVIGGLAGRQDFEPTEAPARPGEVQRTALDSGRAGTELGWRAETAIERGLELTLEALRVP